MSTSTGYDIIISGAGAAGLLLSLSLIEKGYKGSVLVLDQSLSPKNDKTWCFWSDELLFDGNLLKKHWSKLSVHQGGKDYFSETKNQFYQCLSSEKLQKHALDILSEQSNFTLVEASVVSTGQDPEKAWVETDIGKFEANCIYQSIKPPADFYEHSEYALKQHFLGWEIQSKKPIFKEDTVTLMDFDVPQKGGLSFMYELPFSENEGLVEFTLFTPDVLEIEIYEQEIIAYLKQKYNLTSDDFKILRIEFGVIPMVECVMPVSEGKRIFNIGTAGGVTKASTGYTFKRSLHQANYIAEKLISSNQLVSPDANISRFRYYDLLILHIIANKPELAEFILFNLFDKNGFDKVFRFLSEETSFSEELVIMASCPWTPFLAAVWQTKNLVSRVTKPVNP